MSAAGAMRTRFRINGNAARVRGHGTGNPSPTIETLPKTVGCDPCGRPPVSIKRRLLFADRIDAHGFMNGNRWWFIP